MDAPQFIAWGLYAFLFASLEFYRRKHGRGYQTLAIRIWAGAVVIYYLIVLLDGPDHAFSWWDGHMWSMFLRILAAVTMLIQLYLVAKLRADYGTA